VDNILKASGSNGSTSPQNGVSGALMISDEDELNIFGSINEYKVTTSPARNETKSIFNQLPKIILIKINSLNVESITGSEEGSVSVTIVFKPFA